MENSKEHKMVVIGATGGIGSALVHELNKSGFSVILGARNVSNIAPELANASIGSETIDVESWDSVEQFFQQIAERFGEFYGVALCVGSVLLKPAHLTKEDEYRKTMSLNLDSAFAVIRSSVKFLRKSGGSIVLVSSSAARQGISNHEAIAAAKAGVIGLTLSAAATYASQGVRVNSIAPGLVRTGLTDSIVRNESSLKMSTSMHALGRIGEAQEVSSAIAWMLDPSNSWVTGQVLGVDGGLSSLISRR